MRFILILSILLLSAANDPWPQGIKDHYRGLRRLKAKIEQVKTSPLLLRPLKSQVDLEFKEDTLTWTVSGQKPFAMKFLSGGRTEFLSGGSALSELPKEARQRLDASIGLIRKILVMDPALDQDFMQTWSDQTLTITPKSNSVFFEWVSITFRKDRSIESMSFKTADEQTRLTFITFAMNQP
jgi:hypothetical protein